MDQTRDGKEGALVNHGNLGNCCVWLFSTYEPCFLDWVSLKKTAASHKITDLLFNNHCDIPGETAEINLISVAESPYRQPHLLSDPKEDA